MTTSIKLGADIYQTFDYVEDIASTLASVPSYCGLKSYELVGG